MGENTNLEKEFLQKLELTEKIDALYKSLRDYLFSTQGSKGRDATRHWNDPTVRNITDKIARMESLLNPEANVGKFVYANAIVPKPIVDLAKQGIKTLNRYNAEKRDISSFENVESFKEEKVHLAMVNNYDTKTISFGKLEYTVNPLCIGSNEPEKFESHADIYRRFQGNRDLKMGSASGIVVKNDLGKVMGERISGIFIPDEPEIMRLNWTLSPSRYELREYLLDENNELFVLVGIAEDTVKYLVSTTTAEERNRMTEISGY